MLQHDFGISAELLAAPLPMFHARVTPESWTATARLVAGSGGRLVSAWGLDRGEVDGGLAACAAYAIPDGLLWLELALNEAAPDFPDLAATFPCADRMQRAMTDLVGIRPQGSDDNRPWLDHGLWATDLPPLRCDANTLAADSPAGPAPEYAFVRVEGDGVHEIAVGPVHAGIIEPGHFRFSVVGEKVLRLEERLGYAHKGIERRFTELPASEAARLAGRISGDSTVAYAWAYCMALESAWACEIPQQATWLRALMLERERVANHLGDLGALGNDAGVGFGLAQFSRLREDWLRLSADLFGHRLMMDAVVPGGVAIGLIPAMHEALRAQCEDVEREVRIMETLYSEHAGLQDRFMGAGIVTPALAAQLGLTGLAGRASGRRSDLRRDHSWTPYNQLDVKLATRDSGDVAARVAVRFDETFESIRLIRALSAGMPADGTWLRPEPLDVPSRGAGWVEGWRGEILVTLDLASDGRIVRCHCRDPSWQNWPVVEHALIGNIVPDFPLINKSFNLSYSGHDL